MVGKKKEAKLGGKERKTSNSNEEGFSEDLNSLNSTDAEEAKMPMDKKKLKTKRKYKTVTSPRKIAKKRGRKSNESMVEGAEEDLDVMQLDLEM